MEPIRTTVEESNGAIGYEPANGNGARPGPADAPERGRLIERLRALWDQRRFLLRVTALATLAAIIGTLLIPNRYESTARIMPPEKESNGMGAAVMGALLSKASPGTSLGTMAGDMLGIKGTGQLFVGVLRSRTIADHLIEEFDLRHVYGKKHDEDVRKKLADFTEVSEDRKSGIITITVTDWDKRRAQAMAGAYVDELNHVLAEVSTSAAHRERVFLEGRLKGVTQDLDQASRDFGEFASKNTTLDIKEQGRAMMSSVAQLQGELIAQQAELSGLEQIYTSNNVRVRSVRARIAELRRELGKMEGQGGSEASTGSLESSIPSIREIPMLGVTYTDLARRVKVEETVYEMLTQQYEMAKVQEAKEVATAKVLDAASFPDKKSFPPRLLIVLAIAFCVFAAAAEWVLARKRWHDADDHDPAKVLALEVFQTVNAKMPWAPPNGSRWQAATHRAWVRIAGNGANGR